MNYWLRLYTGILDDPKVQRLHPEQFKGWINLLCLAKENDGLLPSLEDTAFRLRMSEADTQSLIEVLAGRGLLDSTDEGVTPHNWEGRQFISDEDPTAAIRARRYRAKQQNVTDSVTRDVTGPSLLSETEYRAETETEQRQSGPVSRAKPRSTRRPTVCDEEWLVELQTNPAYTGLDVKALFCKMVVWCQNKGKQPTRGRLINWLNREDKPMTAPAPSNGGSNGRYEVPRKETHNERAARETAELFERSLAALNGTDGPDTADANPTWLAADYRRV